MEILPTQVLDLKLLGWSGIISMLNKRAECSLKRRRREEVWRDDGMDEGKR